MILEGLDLVHNGLILLLGRLLVSLSLPTQHALKVPLHFDAEPRLGQRVVGVEVLQLSLQDVLGNRLGSWLELGLNTSVGPVLNLKEVPDGRGSLLALPQDGVVLERVFKVCALARESELSLLPTESGIRIGVATA